MYQIIELIVATCEVENCGASIVLDNRNCSEGRGREKLRDQGWEYEIYTHKTFCPLHQKECQEFLRGKS